MNATARRLLVTVGIGALAAVNLASQYRYVSDTNGATPQWEIMLTRLSALGSIPTGQPVMLDIPELGKANIAALYARGRSTAKYAGETKVSPFSIDEINESDRSALARSGAVDLGQLGRKLADAYRRLVFPLGPAHAASHEFFRFEFPPGVDAARAVTVTPAADESVVNDSADRPPIGRYYVSAEADRRNHLAQVDSNLAHIVYPGILDDVALWQREPDFASDRGIQAMGRHLLFEVVNPIPGSRMLFDFTMGALTRQDLALPPAAIIGEQRVDVGLVGRGAARMLTGPITPKTIEGRSYIAIDMGAEPQRVLTARGGILGLYNRHLSLDPRRIVGFTRNISMLTEEQAKAMTPPSAIESFPSGLFQPGLLFSGVYEDGWMAEVARFRLGSGRDGRVIRIKGQVPGFNPRLTTARLELLIDGQPVALRQFGPGNFELEAAVPAAHGPRWIELRVDATFRLPDPDLRVASVLLKSIAVEAAH